MRLWARLASVGTAVSACALVALGEDYGHEGLLPKTAVDALEWSQPLIEPARRAKSVETAEIAKGIRRAVDWMQPFRAKGAADPTWSTTWNEALTLTRFHKNKPTADYILEKKHLDGNYVLFGLPVGRGWSCDTPETDQYNSGYFGGISHHMPGGALASSIKISVYAFRFIYFDTIDGANATALAKLEIERLRGEFAKVDSISASVTARSLSRGFSRAHYVEAQGRMDKAGQVRIRTYYCKGAYRTYEFRVTEYRDTNPDDVPVQAWQKGVEDPELDAVLETLEEGELKKAR
jgi:hypothetical protein